MKSVKLSPANAEKMKSFKDRYKGRSLTKKDLEQMLNLAIEAISDSQWEKMFEQHIPDDVLIKQALSSPEAKKALAEYIRKNNKKAKSASSSQETDHQDEHAKAS